MIYVVMKVSSQKRYLITFYSLALKGFVDFSIFCIFHLDVFLRFFVNSNVFCCFIQLQSNIGIKEQRGKKIFKSISIDTKSVSDLNSHCGQNSDKTKVKTPSDSPASIHSNFRKMQYDKQYKKSNGWNGIRPN